MLYSSLATGEHTSMDVAVTTEEATGHKKTTVLWLIYIIQYVAMYIRTYIHTYVASFTMPSYSKYLAKHIGFTTRALYNH